MLYELIAIVRPGNVKEVRDIARTAGRKILTGGGVVRGISNWGVFLLPKALRKNQTLYNTGHHFIVRFDSSAHTQNDLKRTLGLDPRLLRFSVIKMGSTLQEIKAIPGTVQFGKPSMHQ